MFLMAKKTKTVPVYMRLPVSLKKALEKSAQKNRRTFTTEAEIALEEYLTKTGDWPPSDEASRK